MMTMETTLAHETFTAADFARELELIHDWRPEEVEAFLEAADTEPRTFAEWTTLVTAWAADTEPLGSRARAHLNPSTTAPR